MTEEKNFKRRIRERMQKTGESYTSARKQLNAKREELARRDRREKRRAENKRQHEELLARLSEDARWVLEQADLEAEERGHSYLGSEHLLLALLKKRSSRSRALQAVDREDVIREIDRIVQDAQLAQPPRSRPLTPRAKAVLSGVPRMTLYVKCYRSEGQSRWSVPMRLAGTEIDCERCGGQHRVPQGPASEPSGWKSQEIGSRHLLLGLLRQDDSVANQVLRNLNYPLSESRARLAEELEESPVGEMNFVSD